MTESIETRAALKRRARVAGIYYAILALAMFPVLIRGGIIVPGDPTATSRAVLANLLAVPGLLGRGEIAQAMSLLDASAQAILVAEIFWGLWMLPFGLLVYKSGFLPKALGVLLAAGCFGYLAYACVAILAPEHKTAMAPAMTFSGAIELIAVAYFLVFGVKRPPAEAKSPSRLEA
jgi:hypothetical protein